MHNGNVQIIIRFQWRVYILEGVCNSGVWIRGAPLYPSLIVHTVRTYVHMYVCVHEYTKVANSSQHCIVHTHSCTHSRHIG